MTLMNGFEGGAMNGVSGIDMPLHISLEGPTDASYSMTNSMTQNMDSCQIGGAGGIPSNENSSATVPASKPSCAPAPMVEIKLFVGRVPQCIDEAALQPIFEEFGEVKETIVIRDKVTGKHKSSAFIKMASIAQADLAIRSLNNCRVLDSNLGPIQVKYATGEAEKLGLSAAAGEAGLDQAKLFVGSLPKTVNEDQIRELFGPFGIVEEIFIMKDNATGQGKGCAFVKFAFKEQAIYAIQSVDGKHTVEGCSRPVEVRFAESRTQRQQQTQDMGTVGTWGSPMGTPAMVAPPSNNTPRVAGAWKEYFAPDGRPYYHNEYTGATQWDRPTEFEQLPIMGNTSGGVASPPGANIFIFHIPNEWTQQDLIQYFGGFGSVISARIATDKTSGRNRGFAFVSYDNIESAAAAVNHMNGFMALGKRLKVTIKKGEEHHVQHLLMQCGAQGSVQGASNAAPGYGMPQQWGGYGGGNFAAQRFAPY